MTYTVQLYTPDDEQTNCPKHVQFYSKNKFEKLVHLDGFIMRIYHDARSSECQIKRIQWPLRRKTKQSYRLNKMVASIQFQTQFYD
jgi:hypothetical protein